jgi:hypothetical protein
MSESRNVVRYIVRSKDRLNATVGNPVSPVTGPTTNSPMNFQVLFNPAVDARVSEFWVKLVNFSLASLPYGVTKSLPVAGVRHGFDTSAFVDLCVDFQEPFAFDTEQGIAEKLQSDKTFATIAYDRNYGETMARLALGSNEYPWIRVRNNGNLNFISVKLFADTGLQLATKLFSATTSDSADNATNAPAGTTGVRCQFLDLPFAAAPAGVARGHEVYTGTTTPALQITNLIYGTITVISVTGSTVRIGFPSQILSAQIPTGTLVSFHANAPQLPLQDWSMELLVSPTNPVETRLL